MPNSNKTRSRWPLVLAFLATIISYAIVLWWSSLHAFAAASSILIGLVVLTCIRLVESRGKLSLKMTTIVLPIVVAIACIGLMRLNPFRQRHLTMVALDKAGIQVYAHTPERHGEWYCDPESKILLPYWLARFGGEHSLSYINNAHGTVDSFQSIDLRKLYLPHLQTVKLTKDSSDPPLSAELISSLSEVKALESVELFAAELSAADIPGLKALAKLSHIEVFELILPIDKVTVDVDLSILPKNCWLRITGTELSAQRAAQLQHLPFIELTVSSLPLASIEVLNSKGPRWLIINGCNFNAEEASAITRFKGDSLALINCTFPKEFSPSSKQAGVNRLTLQKTPIAQDTLVQWLSTSQIDALQTDQVLDEAFVNTLRELKKLKWLGYQTSSGEQVSANLMDQ